MAYLSLPSHVKHIANYVRKSREEELRSGEAGDDLLEKQAVMMANILKQFEVPFTQFREYGSGDSLHGRPVFRNLLADLQEKKFQAIAVRSIDRLGRGSYSDTGIIFDTIRDNRILIICQDKVYDPRNRQDLRVIRMTLYIAREELENILERFDLGRDGSIKDLGRFISSRPAYGYTSLPKVKTLTPYIDEESKLLSDKAKMVQQIFDWFVNEKIGTTAISTRLTGLVPTSTGNKHWHAEVIKKMLQNPVYLGHIYYRTTENVKDPTLKRGFRQVKRPKEEWLIHKHAHPAIIDEDTFDRAQDRFANGQQLALPVKEQFMPCELASLVTCDSCGKKLIRQSSTQHYPHRKDESKKSVYLKEFLYCIECRQSYKYRDVEDLILENLRMMGNLDEAMLLDFMIKKVEKAKEPSKYLATSLDLLLHKEKKVKDQLDTIYELLETKWYTQEKFNDRRGKAEAELSRVQDEIALFHQQHSEASKDDLDTTMIRVKMKSVLEAYEQLSDKSLKNTLLRKIFHHVVVHKLQPGKGRKAALLKVDAYFNFDFFA